MAEDARSFIDRVGRSKGLNTIAGVAEVLRHMAVCVDELKREVAETHRYHADEAKSMSRKLSELEGNIALYVARFGDHIKSSDDSSDRVEEEIKRLWHKLDGRPVHANGGNGTVLRLSFQGLMLAAIVVGGLASFANPQFADFLRWIVGIGKAGQ